MPELPEVEAVVRSLKADGIEGSRLLSAHILRPIITRPQSPEDVEAASSGTIVNRVERRAKNILLHLSNKHTIRIHLRMTGDLALQPDAADEPPALRAEWKLNRRRRLVFTDLRALGRVHVYQAAELEQLLRALGPEPLSRAFTVERLAAIARRSKLPAKLFLMDQTKISGLGNIYAAEALFRAGVSPRKPMAALSNSRLERLHGAIRETLRAAVHSVYKAYRSPGGYRQHGDDFNRFVYGRKGLPCVRCGSSIEQIVQGGRSTYFCAHCQR